MSTQGAVGPDDEWVVTGAGGMLGRAMVAHLRDAGARVRPLVRADLDVTDAGAVAAALDGARVVVNCAAVTDVDGAETDEAGAFAVNALAPALLARGARATGARLVHVSTDYVFDGVVGEYAEDDPVRPLQAYGRTKAAGEWGVLADGGDHVVVRTGWLYADATSGFPSRILRALRERGELQAVEDQLGQPTCVDDLAGLLADLGRGGAPVGVYHGTASGSASRYDFITAIVEAAGHDPALVRSVPSSQAPVPAVPRPRATVLGHAGFRGTGVEPIGPWRERWVQAVARQAPSAGG